MDLLNVDKLVPVTGSTLNTEELVNLRASMIERKIEENLSQKFLFWGKVYGISQDYLVAVNISNGDEFLSKKFYFCTTSDYTLRLLPQISKEFEVEADQLLSQFTGDPAYYPGAENSEEGQPEAEDEDDDEKQKRKNKLLDDKIFREIHRLAYTVRKIDHDCVIVPRGALTLDVKKNIIYDTSFHGLSYQTAKEHRGYMHFRPPENAQSIVLLKQPGLVISSDILDCIDKDYPSALWSIRIDDMTNASYLRHHYWHGYSFYSSIIEDPSDPAAGTYGGAYFGNGLPNKDILFML